MPLTEIMYNYGVHLDMEHSSKYYSKMTYNKLNK